MKRILLSIMTISLVSAVAFGATKAYFTDTETKTGNTFAAGTIDIAVDGQNPWARTTPYQLEDMKPSQVDYANFVIQNVGTNPANVFKKVDIDTEGETDGIVSEPECVDGGGVWVSNPTSPGARECTSPDGHVYVPKNDISTAIRYDLKVWVYDIDPIQNPTAEPKWWQFIYTDAMDKRLSTLNHQDVLLGMIPVGWYMKVEQSYHMDSDTGNWAQGDQMTFDITLTAEQLKGTVLLQNKDFADAVNPTLNYDGGLDNIKGTLTYGVKDSKFNYSFTGVAPLASTPYSLIFYEEPFSTPSASGWPRTVIVLGSATSDVGKNVSIPSTSLELNQNILNMKVWLVKTSDLTGDTLSAFSGNDYLFELGLMDYYDADL